jgi:hypothetical protein
MWVPAVFARPRSLEKLAPHEEQKRSIIFPFTRRNLPPM